MQEEAVSPFYIIEKLYHENTPRGENAIAPMSFSRKRESREPRNFWIPGQARNDGIFMLGGDTNRVMSV